jgi:hypothetical protein
MIVASTYQDRPPEFKWADAGLYAVSDKGPVKRLDLPSGKLKAFKY